MSGTFGFNQMLLKQFRQEWEAVLRPDPRENKAGIVQTGGRLLHIGEFPS